MAVQPFGPWPLFRFLHPIPVSMIPWTGDQPIARQQPTHKTTRTEQTHIDIRASSRIRTHDPSVRAGEDGLCLGLRGHCDGP
jgi:hypothetical protein